ncbi:CA-related protein [Penaeus vannamei]|uniref:CA-related protein n=1 Tax=Penaeus vannamei TaxID=6689 RepID=A0A3R7Q0J3_PENVA|nr:CA-related protein [Penaeus vannamei]
MSSSGSPGDAGHSAFLHSAPLSASPDCEVRGRVAERSATHFSRVNLLVLIPGLLASWDEWWTYDGISGPEFWGLINPNWNMCERGRRQSPVNIEPRKLVYDPHLRHVHVDKHRVSGSLHNTGQSVIFRVEKGSKHHVNITGGPLVYKYRFQDLYIHFGAANHQGSEHQINGAAFPAEVSGRLRAWAREDQRGGWLACSCCGSNSN